MKVFRVSDVFAACFQKISVSCLYLATYAAECMEPPLIFRTFKETEEVALLPPPDVILIQQYEDISFPSP